MSRWAPLQFVALFSPIALALSLAFPVLADPPVALEAGAPAPFAGVLVDEARARELVEAEAEVKRLRAHLEAEARLRAALEASWEARLKTAEAPPEWFEDPELNRWAGFAAGVVVAAGALFGGAWLSGLAAEGPPE